MSEKAILLLGGLEIILGGLMTAYPLLLPQWVGLIMAAVGVVTVAYASRSIFVDLRTTGGSRVGIIPMWRVQFDDVVPFRRTISLAKAARYVRDRTLGTDYALSAERLSEGSVLRWIVTSLALRQPVDDPAFPGPLQLYGVPPGASRRVIIPMQDRQTGTLEIVDDEVVMKQPWDEVVMYSKLEILRSELKKRLRHLRAMKLT